MADDAAYDAEIATREEQLHRDQSDLSLENINLLIESGYFPTLTNDALKDVFAEFCSWVNDELTEIDHDPMGYFLVAVSTINRVDLIRHLYARARTQAFKRARLKWYTLILAFLDSATVPEFYGVEFEDAAAEYELAGTLAELSVLEPHLDLLHLIESLRIKMDVWATKATVANEEHDILFGYVPRQSKDVFAHDHANHFDKQKFEAFQRARRGKAVKSDGLALYRHEAWVHDVGDSDLMIYYADFFAQGAVEGYQQWAEKWLKRSATSNLFETVEDGVAGATEELLAEGGGVSDDAITAVLTAYEQTIGIPPGTATIDQVAATSAGLQGWLDSDLCRRLLASAAAERLGGGGGGGGGAAAKD